MSNAERLKAYFDAQKRASGSAEPVKIGVPLAKARMRKRIAAAQQVGDEQLESELRDLLSQIERVFPD